VTSCGARPSLSLMQHRRMGSRSNAADRQTAHHTGPVQAQGRQETRPPTSPPADALVTAGRQRGLEIRNGVLTSQLRPASSGASVAQTRATRRPR
jgi:hypothetical protein